MKNCFVILQLITILSVSNFVFALVEIPGSLYAVFERDGHAIYEFREAEWIRKSASFQKSLMDIVPINSREFFARMDFSLVHLDINGNMNIILEKVESFTYNKQKNLIFAVTYDGNNRELKMIEFNSNSLMNVKGHPTLHFRSGIASYGNQIIIESADEVLYIADIDKMVFSKLIQGEDPVYSDSGQYLAFLSPTKRQLKILDTKTHEVKTLGAQDVGILTWIGDQTLVYSYSWRGFLMIYPIMRIAISDINTGETKLLPRESSPSGLTWMGE